MQTAQKAVDVAWLASESEIADVDDDELIEGTLRKHENESESAAKEEQSVLRESDGAFGFSDVESDGVLEFGSEIASESVITRKRKRRESVDETDESVQPQNKQKRRKLNNGSGWSSPSETTNSSMSFRG